jgi:predicted DNA-binding transcriptional regulator AlpA
MGFLPHKAIRKSWRLLVLRVLSLQPRGLNRVQAAGYVGVSPSLFDEMVTDGRMPSPKMINGRRVWDRRELDVAFDAIPAKEQSDPWDCPLSA